MPIEFKNSQLAVNMTANSIDVVVVRNNGTNTASSANVLFNGADVLFPAAQQYNDIKKQVSWAAGESGEKTISIPIEPSSNNIEYLVLTLDDVLGDALGNKSRTYVGLHKTDNIPSFNPATPGDYIMLLTVNNTGGSTYNYLKPGENGKLLEPNFSANTATENGKAGNVPAPPKGINPQLLSNTGWMDSPIPTIQSDINNLKQTKANLESPKFTGIVEAPTPGSGAVPNQVATVNYVKTEISNSLEGVDLSDLQQRVTNVETNKAPLASPKLTGVPEAPVPSTSAPATQIATTGYVKTEISNSLEGVDLSELQQRVTNVETNKAPLANPKFTGTPESVTPPANAPLTQITTVEYVNNKIQTSLEGVDLSELEARVDNVEANKANLESPKFTGNPEATTPLPTATGNEIATAQFVKSTIAANKESDFTANTASTSGTSGNVPAPPASTDPMVLTNNGWSSTPKIKNPDLTSNDNSVATTQFVKQTVSEVAGKVWEPGMVIMTAGDVAPMGWLLCDGSAVSRTQYADLFSAVGTKWGSGDGSTTFNLPPSAKRYIMGAGADVGVGTVGGNSKIQLSVDQLPSHDHTITTFPHTHTGTSGEHTHALSIDPHSHTANSPEHNHSLLIQPHGHTGAVDPHTHTGTVAPHDHGLDLYYEGDKDFPGRDFDDTASQPESRMRTDMAEATLNIDPASPGISINPSNIDANLSPAQVGVEIGFTSLNGGVQPASSAVSIDATEQDIKINPMGNNADIPILPDFIAFNFIIKV